jgi:hypothetical protein
LTLFFRAFETGQPFFAASAACWNFAWSIPGTWPRDTSRIVVMRNPSPTLSTVHAALVVIRVAGVPACSSPTASAMLKQAAWAAAISSSGFDPFVSPNRVPNE